MPGRSPSTSTCGATSSPRNRGGRFPTGRSTPGYTINDGVFVSPTLGLRIGDRVRHHFLIGISYLGQDADLKAPALDSRPGLGDGHERRFIHALRLRLGYQF